MGGRRGPIIAGAAALVIVLLTAVFLVLPKLSSVSDARTRLDQAVAQESTLRSQLAALNQAQAEAPKARQTIRTVDQAIPPTADEQGLILLLQNAADQAGIDLFTVTPGSPSFDPTTELTTIPATLSVTGSYFAIDEFLFRVETLPRAAKVLDITLGPGDNGELTMTADANLFTTDASAGPGSFPGPTSPGEATGAAAPAPVPSPAATSPSIEPSPAA